MSRPLRIEYEGAWYHVMNRGAGRRQVFRGPAEGRLFLDLLGELDETFGVETHAYCLLGNHYHLLLRTPRGNLGRAMRHLGGLFTQRANRLAGRDGPIFRGRYKAVLIEAEAHLAAVGRYIHLNPVMAGLVRRPEAWRWSSYPAYLGRTVAPAWLHMAETLAGFGTRGARERYRAFVADGTDEETAAFYQRGRLEPVLGGRAFRQKVERRLAKAPAQSEAALRRRLAVPGLGQIIAATAAEFGQPRKSLLEPRRGRGQRNPARDTAVGLARTLGGQPLAAIAETFGYGHTAGASSAVGRFRRDVADDPSLARRVKRIKRELEGSKKH
jgi:REP element-mobilizing transposase RayT